MNGSTWNDYRFVSYQSKKPFLLETVSEPFYIDRYKALGYKTIASYFSQETSVLTDNWSKCESRYNHFLETGMTFEEFDLSKPEEEFFALALERTFCSVQQTKMTLFKR